jgi:hypothetical protein
VANTGRFCFLVDRSSVARSFLQSFRGWVGGHDFLKNLSVMEEVDIRGPTVMYGDCDRITPRDVLEFLQETPHEGVRVFVVSSVYGDCWEEVTA